MDLRLLKLFSISVLSVALLGVFTTVNAIEYKCYVSGVDKNHYIVLSDTVSLKHAKKMSKEAPILRRGKSIRVNELIECVEEKSAFTLADAKKMDAEFVR